MTSAVALTRNKTRKRMVKIQPNEEGWNGQLINRKLNRRGGN